LADVYSLLLLLILMVSCVCQQYGLNVPGPMVKYTTTTTDGSQMHSAGMAWYGLTSPTRHI